MLTAISQTPPDYAVNDYRWHTIRPWEFNKIIEDRLMSMPKFRFCELKAGGTAYYYKSYRDECIIFPVKVTPSGAQVVANIRYRSGDSTNVRLFRAQYHGEFLLLDQLLTDMISVSHEAVVNAAVDMGKRDEVPAIVRCDHPNLFVQVPERFTLHERTRSVPITGNDRLRELVRSMDPEKPMNGLRIERMIDGIHETIQMYRDCLTRAIEVNPRIRGDYERYVKEYEEQIEFYRWCQPLFEPGGVLYIEGSESYIPEERKSPFNPEPKYAEVLARSQESR